MTHEVNALSSRLGSVLDPARYKHLERDRLLQLSTV